MVSVENRHLYSTGNRLISFFLRNQGLLHDIFSLYTVYRRPDLYRPFSGFKMTFKEVLDKNVYFIKKYFRGYHLKYSEDYLYVSNAHLDVFSPQGVLVQVNRKFITYQLPLSPTPFRFFELLLHSRDAGWEAEANYVLQQCFDSIPHKEGYPIEGKRVQYYQKILHLFDEEDIDYFFRLARVVYPNI